MQTQGTNSSHYVASGVMCTSHVVEGSVRFISPGKSFILWKPSAVRIVRKSRRACVRACLFILSFFFAALQLVARLMFDLVVVHVLLLLLFLSLSCSPSSTGCVVLLLFFPTFFSFAVAVAVSAYDFLL